MKGNEMIRTPHGGTHTYIRRRIITLCARVGSILPPFRVQWCTSRTHSCSAPPVQEENTRAINQRTQTVRLIKRPAETICFSSGHVSHGATHTEQNCSAVCTLGFSDASVRVQWRIARTLSLVFFLAGSGSGRACNQSKNSNGTPKSLSISRLVNISYPFTIYRVVLILNKK